jgi:hypothetical protein
MKKYFFVILALFVFPLVCLSAASLSSHLAGRILLQVESNGEAWYVNPASKVRYFLGRPADAFRIMREQGIGITNNDLKKIPVAEDNLDELSALDSDNDGYADIVEIRSGYNPYGQGRLVFDAGFAERNLGKIFLQVESKGEAWYVNPIDKKRYYMGRPANAFQIMRKLGLGITNANLEQVAIGDSAVPKTKTTITELADKFGVDFKSFVEEQGIVEYEDLETYDPYFMVDDMKYSVWNLEGYKKVDVAVVSNFFKTVIDNIKKEVSAYEVEYGFENESELSAKKYLDDFIKAAEDEAVPFYEKQIDYLKFAQDQYNIILANTSADDRRPGSAVYENMEAAFEKDVKKFVVYSPAMLEAAKYKDFFYLDPEGALSGLWADFRGDTSALKAVLDKSVFDSFEQAVGI